MKKGADMPRSGGGNTKWKWKRIMIEALQSGEILWFVAVLEQTCKDHKLLLITAYDPYSFRGGGETL